MRLLPIAALCLIGTSFRSIQPKNIDYTNFRKEKSFQETIDFNHIDYERIEMLIFYITNEVRAKHHLKTLEFADKLSNTARMHAEDMVREGFFDHINHHDQSKQTPDDRAKLMHIPNPHLSENLIEGYALQYKAGEDVYIHGKGEFSKTQNGPLLKPHTYLSFCDEQIVKWMNSPGHRKNILSQDALQLGCGAAFFKSKNFNEMPTFYVVQNFQCFEAIHNQ